MAILWIIQLINNNEFILSVWAICGRDGFAAVLKRNFNYIENDSNTYILWFVAVLLEILLEHIKINNGKFTEHNNTKFHKFSANVINQCKSLNYCMRSVIVFAVILKAKKLFFFQFKIVSKLSVYRWTKGSVEVRLNYKLKSYVHMLMYISIFVCVCGIKPALEGHVSYRVRSRSERKLTAWKLSEKTS